MLTVPNVIENVYGTAASCAEKLGVRRSAVSNWKAFGKFPARLAASICAHAREAGVDLDISEIPLSDALARAPMISVDALQ